VFKDTIITINFEDMAVNKISLECMDENGNLLNLNDTTLLQAYVTLAIEFPDSFVLASSSYCTSILSNGYFSFSDVNDTYKILVNRFNVLQEKLYITDMGQLNGLSGDVTLANEPSEFIKMKMTINSQPNTFSNYLTFGYGERFQNNYSLISSDNTDYPTYDKDTLNIYLANRTNINNSLLSFIGTIFLWDTIPDYDFGSNSNRCVRTEPFFLNNNDSIVFAEFQTRITPAQYIIEGGNTVSLGDAAPVYYSFIDNNFMAPNSIFPYLNISFGGIHETRSTDNNFSIYEIIKDGSIVVSDMIDNFTEPYVVSELGPYSFSLSNTNYKILDKQGLALMDAHFDLSNTIDANPPTLTAFRITDSNGLVNNSFLNNDQGQLLFSAFDFDMTTYNLVKPTEVTVFFKKYSENDWIELATIEHPNWFENTTYGSFYTCELGEAFAQFTSSDYLELKIILSDSVGNTNTYTWHPAAFIENTITQPWPFTVTGLTHTIQIPASVNPDIFGEPLETGDWVGVFFTDDSGNEFCGGAKEINPFGSTTVTAYGNDITTTEKDGFADGETFRWKMYDVSESMEYYASVVYDETMPNQGNFADLGLSKLIEMHAAFGQFYSFSEGWNSMSSYITPYDASVENLLSPISNELIIMRNLTDIYWPGENVNTIGEFNNESGYAIKITNDLQFNIQGESNASPTVTLEAGWHYLPVLSECPAAITDVFGESIDDVVIIQDLIGTGVYWPEMGIYTLEELQPGLAYKIKLANEVTFTFPECFLKSSPLVTQKTNRLSTPWGEINMTPSSQIVAILQPAMDQLEQGDAIGIFDDNGTPYGYLNIDATNQNQALVVFGNDPSSSIKNGFASGDQTYFRLLRASTGEEFELEVEYDNTMDNNSGRYQSGSFAAITNFEMKNLETGIPASNLEIYPNPANDELSIKLNNSDSGIVSLKIMNATGQTIVDKYLNAKIKLNVSSYTGGIYYVKISTGTFNEVRKIVIR